VVLSIYFQNHYPIVHLAFVIDSIAYPRRYMKFMREPEGAIISRKQYRLKVAALHVGCVLIVAVSATVNQDIVV